MILKLQSADKDEIISGFDRISYTELENGVAVGLRSDCLDFPEQQAAGDSGDPVCEIWLYNGTEVVRQILSLRPIYVMNDQGTTVQRLYLFLPK